MPADRGEWRAPFPGATVSRLEWDPEFVRYPSGNLH